MSKLEQEVDTKEVTALKSQIGFGTAFKATLGFYAAQFIASLAMLAILAIIGLVVVSILYFIYR